MPKSKQGKPGPGAMRTVTPHIVCDGAAKAIAFYKKAFDAEEVMRLDAPNGKLMHGCVRIGDSHVMLVDEDRDWCAFGPKMLKGSPVTIHLNVEDADAVVKRAVAAGAKVVMPVADMFWGDRYGVIEDPFGHRWSVATHVRDVSMDELKKAVASMPAMEKPKGKKKAKAGAKKKAR